MDLRISYLGICLFIQMVVVLTLTQHQKDHNCRMCKPGYYASRLCSETYDTVCKPCSIGTFTPVYSVFKKCSPCSRCDLGEFALKECSKRHDTVCESCSAVSKLVNSNFLKECAQNDGSSLGRLTEGEGIALEDTNNENVDKDSANPEVIYEGSGTSITGEDVDQGHVDKILNETEPEEEGSGETPKIDETDESTNISVIVPDETVDGSDNTTETTTQESGIIVIGPGIKLENTTEATTPKNILINTANDNDKNGDLNISGEVVVDDIVLPNEPESELPDYNTIDDNKPQTGASKKQDHHVHSGGTSIGVVVTIGLVAAFVFFVLGFLASRYWSGRRERTFNVMEAEKLNGKSSVECSGIEYKDTDNNIRGKPSVYDEIPADKKPHDNGREVQAPMIEAASNPVYSTPLKRGTIPDKTETPVTTPVNGTHIGQDNRFWGGFCISRNSSSGSLVMIPEQKSPRPVSAIKYIDEEDHRETDRLINQPSTSSDDSKDKSTSDSDVTTDGDNKTDRDSPDENTPMISKQPNNRES